jgi:hypothetical protein
MKGVCGERDFVIAVDPDLIGCNQVRISVQGEESASFAFLRNNSLKKVNKVFGFNQAAMNTESTENFDKVDFRDHDFPFV